MNKSSRRPSVHWNRLESLLNNSSAIKSSREFRPKSSLSVPKGRTASRVFAVEQPPVFKVKRCESLDTSTQKSSVFVEGLTSSAITNLYRAKCKDLGIPPLPDQEFRFFKFCSQQFSNRRFSYKEAGLGLESAGAIANALRHTIHFGAVDLSRNSLGDPGAVLLVKALFPFVDLAHLDLSNNNISPEGCAEIFRRVKRFSSLASLDVSSNEGLHRNRLGVLGCSELSKCLQKNKVLSILNISGTSIGTEGLNTLADGLSNSGLHSLNLSNNGLVSLDSLIEAVLSSNLLNLDLSENGLGNESCENLHELISLSKSLERLYLSKTEISSKGISKIFQALRQNGRLKGLILDGNPLTQGPSSVFFDTLSENFVLSAISLARCGIPGDEMRSLGNVLRVNAGLTYLNLSTNYIDGACAESIASGLAQNSKLRILDLSFNQIRDRGGVALALALRSNKTLECLLLADNNLKDETGSALTETLRVNTFIFKITLDKNFVGKKHLIDISEALENNRENFYKSLAGRLRRRIDGMRINDSTIDMVYKKITRKKEEKEDIRKNTYRYRGRLEIVKKQEEQKHEELKGNLEQYRRENLALSEYLQDLEVEKRKQLTNAEKTAQLLEDQLQAIVREVQTSEDKSKIYVESKIEKQNAERKLQLHASLAELKNQLHAEEIAYRTARNNLENMKHRLSVKLHPPKPAYTPRETKTFLASEKLAVSKKKATEPTYNKSRSSSKPKKSIN